MGRKVMILISRIIFFVGCLFISVTFFFLIFRHSGIALRFLNYSFFFFLVGLAFYIFALLGSKPDGENKEK